MYRLLEVGETIERGDLSWWTGEWKLFAEHWIGRVHEKGDYPIKREVKSEIENLKTQLQLSKDIVAERDKEIYDFTNQVMSLNSDRNELYLKERAEKEKLIKGLKDFAIDNEIWNDTDYENLVGVCIGAGIAKNVPYNIALHGIELQDEYDIDEGVEIVWFGDDNPEPKDPK